MDMNNHIVTGFLMAYLPLKQVDETTAIIGGIAHGLYSGIPDAVPDINALFGKWDKWSIWFYDKAHSFGFWWLNIIPGSLLHIFLDKFCHGEGKTWYFTKLSNWNYFNPFKWFIPNHRIWMETLTWLILLALTWLFVTPYMAIGLLILLTTIIFISERE